MQTVHHNAYADDPYAKEFGIKISEKLASVEARVLPAPWVIDRSCLLLLLGLVFWCSHPQEMLVMVVTRYVLAFAA